MAKKKNQKKENLKLLKNICNIAPFTLNKLIASLLFDYGYRNFHQDGRRFLIAEGETPICLVGHFDTIFPKMPRKTEIYYDQDKEVVWSPHGCGFASRAGIYAIIQLIKRSAYLPTLIFTDGKEELGLGSLKLIKKFPRFPYQISSMLEFGGIGNETAAFYDCTNMEFQQLLKRFNFFPIGGDFADINILAPKYNVAAANLSIGIYNINTFQEYLRMDQCEMTINKVLNLLSGSITDATKNYIYDALSPCRCAWCNKITLPTYKTKQNEILCSYCNEHYRKQIEQFKNF